MPEAASLSIHHRVSLAHFFLGQHATRSSDHEDVRRFLTEAANVSGRELSGPSAIGRSGGSSGASPAPPDGGPSPVRALPLPHPFWQHALRLAQDYVVPTHTALVRCPRLRLEGVALVQRGAPWPQEVQVALQGLAVGAEGVGRPLRRPVEGMPAWPLGWAPWSEKAVMTAAGCESKSAWTPLTW